MLCRPYTILELGDILDFRLPTTELGKYFHGQELMKSVVAKFVQECEICQHAKVEHIKQPGLLQPLDVPNQAWQVVYMDFIEGLPKSPKFDTILVVIDKYAKYAHFIPLAHPFSALIVAQAYLDSVYKLHGLPKGIVSDHDKIFVWRELF